MSDAPDPAATARRPRRMLAAALAALGCAAAGLWWVAAEEMPPLEPRAGVEPVVAANPVPSASAEAERSPEAEPALAATSGADDEIQLCGGHWVNTGSDGSPAEDALRALVTRSREEVASQALALMAASPAPRVQAAAHYYLAGRNGAGEDERKVQAGAHRDALARLAQVSDDPQVYAWAYQSCRDASPGAPGACQQVTAAQWARIDPDNAEPWLAVAEEARRRKDDDALDDAMFHVAAAARHDWGWAALAATVAEHAPHDEPSLLGTYAAIDQARAIESIHSTAWQGTIEYCSAKAIAEPNRRETCERVATVLSDRSTTVLARSMGMAIGRRVGWAAERLAALTRQREAESIAMRRDPGAASGEFPSCAEIRSDIDRIRASAELGEVEMRRREVAASGRPVAELAAEFQSRREADRRAGLAAAAAGSAPAASGVALAQR